MRTRTDVPSVLVLLAPGCEELEAVTAIDVLRRGGVEVVAAGVAGPEGLTASRGVKLVPDMDLDVCTGAKAFDALLLPGGMPGTETLCADPRVRDLLVHYMGHPDKWVACICAAARVLDANGLLEGKRYTCYPGVESRITGGRRLDEPVVVDGRLLSSQGPGTAMAFALALLERLTDRETRDAVADGLLYTE